MQSFNGNNVFLSFFSQEYYFTGRILHCKNKHFTIVNVPCSFRSIKNKSMAFETV